MNSKISPRIDINSLEPSYFTLRLNSAFSDEERQKLTDLGATLQYENGLMALIQVLPTKIEEVAQLESVTEVK